MRASLWGFDHSECTCAHKCFLLLLLAGTESVSRKMRHKVLEANNILKFSPGSPDDV